MRSNLEIAGTPCLHRSFFDSRSFNRAPLQVRRAHFMQDGAEKEFRLALGSIPKVIDAEKRRAISPTTRRVT